MRATSAMALSAREQFITPSFPHCPAPTRTRQSGTTTPGGHCYHEPATASDRVRWPGAELDVISGFRCPIGSRDEHQPAAETPRLSRHATTLATLQLTEPHAYGLPRNAAAVTARHRNFDSALEPDSKPSGIGPPYPT